MIPVATQTQRQRLPRSFYLLLLGQMVSRVGAQVTLIALPLTAIQLHRAGSLETGFLLACGRAPYLLLGPLAGVIADRFSHRILLITANWIMALTLATVPVSALLIGYIGMPHLYTVATLMGGLTVIADVAFLACVPTVVPPQQLVQAQSWLELGQSAALVLGPPLAGWLIYSFSAPIAILADAASFLLVTALLPYVIIAPTSSASMASDYNPDDASSILERVLSEAAEGALFVLRTPKLRAVTFATGTLIFWYSAYSAVFLLYLTEGLGLNATTIGTVSGIAAIGGVIGTLLARPFARTLGLGRVLIAALLTSAVGATLTPLLEVPGWLSLGLSQFVLWIGKQVYSVHQVPIRYALAPPQLHGRVNASIRTIVWGLAPVGAVLGGACGAWLGARATLLLSGALIAGAAGWIWASPLRSMRTPQFVEADT
uniref:Modular protein sulfotransferase N_term, MSF transporter C_term n=2 Tax=Burkholderiaceae TaxID=119060 RepID=A0A375HC12_9BURK